MNGLSIMHSKRFSAASKYFILNLQKQSRGDFVLQLLSIPHFNLITVLIWAKVYNVKNFEITLITSNHDYQIFPEKKRNFKLIERSDYEKLHRRSMTYTYIFLLLSLLPLSHTHQFNCHALMRDAFLGFEPRTKRKRERQYIIWLCIHIGYFQ